MRRRIQERLYRLFLSGWTFAECAKHYRVTTAEAEDAVRRVQERARKRRRLK